MLTAFSVCERYGTPPAGGGPDTRAAFPEDATRIRVVPTAVIAPSRPSLRAGSRAIVAIPASIVMRDVTRRRSQTQEPGAAGTFTRSAAPPSRKHRPLPDDLAVARR